MLHSHILGAVFALSKMRAATAAIGLPESGDEPRGLVVEFCRIVAGAAEPTSGRGRKDMRQIRTNVIIWTYQADFFPDQKDVVAEAHTGKDKNAILEKDLVVLALERLQVGCHFLSCLLVAKSNELEIVHFLFQLLNLSRTQLNRSLSTGNK